MTSIISYFVHQDVRGYNKQWYDSILQGREQ